MLLPRAREYAGADGTVVNKISVVYVVDTHTLDRKTNGQRELNSNLWAFRIRRKEKDEDEDP